MAPAFKDPSWGALSPVGQRRSCSHNKGRLVWQPVKTRPLARSSNAVASRSSSTKRPATLKKASGLMAAANAYLGVHQGSLAYMAVLVVGWLVTQALAVVLLSIEEKGGSQEPKEQQHGSNPEGRRRRAHT